jgi:hypothetical protein
MPTADATIIATLNAPIMWWHNWRYLTHLKDEALSPMGYKMESLPIPHFTDEARNAITPRVETMLALTRQTRAADGAIADWLRTEFGLPKLPRALAHASLLDADGFVAAVRAALPKKQPLTAAALKRLRDEHAATLAPAREQRLSIMGHEHALSRLVNAAYGLTPEDVALMWKTAPPRMPIAAPVP